MFKNIRKIHLNLHRFIKDAETQKQLNIHDPAEAMIVIISQKYPIYVTLCCMGKGLLSFPQIQNTNQPKYQKPPTKTTKYPIQTEEKLEIGKDPTKNKIGISYIEHTKSHDSTTKRWFHEDCMTVSNSTQHQ
uniref:Uncharacterized protein n=1 Tax=Lygus hesperus TaxID=30085 RepID=A0A146KWU1_LYGHE